MRKRRKNPKKGAQRGRLQREKRGGGENSVSCGKTIRLHFKRGEHFMVFGYEVKALCHL